MSASVSSQQHGRHSKARASWASYVTDVCVSRARIHRICDDRPERGGAELASLLTSIPRDRLMVETDAPFITPRSIK
jgi:hypothetical protein